MANGLTPALSGGDDQIRKELATVLFALRRLRADLASGRVPRDSRFLSIEQIDELLAALCPPAKRAAARSIKSATRFHRSDDETVRQRSTKNWNALAEAVS